MKEEGCVFCKIAAGQIPARKLYEDEATLGFLDVYPTAKGHSLVIPKKHYPTLIDIPEMELKELIRVVQKIGGAVMKGMGADGFNVLQNNREAAGQVVHHLHFHIIPRYRNDGIRIAPGTRGAQQGELGEWEALIKRHV